MDVDTRYICVNLSLPSDCSALGCCQHVRYENGGCKFLENLACAFIATEKKTHKLGCQRRETLNSRIIFLFQLFYEEFTCAVVCLKMGR